MRAALHGGGGDSRNSAQSDGTVQVTLPVVSILRRGMKSRLRLHRGAVRRGTGMHGSRETFALRWRRRAALLAGLSLGAGTGVFAQDAGPKSKEVYVASRKFQIPVEIRKAVEQIKQLHLWMSHDQGQTWTKAETFPPTKKHLNFNAPTDGEYQFTLAYEKFDGSISPADVKTRPAGMKVYIDTTKPDIQLRPIRNAADKKVGVSWTIDEAYPKLGTMQLKLKTSKDPTWHELKAPQAIEGKMEWPTDPGDDYVVQLTLEDRAGNTANKTLDVPGYSESMPKPPGPLAKMDALDEPKKPSAKPIGDLDDLGEPPAPKMAAKKLDQMPAPVAMKSPPKMESAELEPPTMTRSAPPMPASSTAMMDAPTPPRNANVFDPSRIDMGPQKPAGDVEPVAYKPKKTAKPADDEGVRQVAHQREHQVAKPVEEPKIKLVKSPRFNMKYSLAGVGVSGVGAVDLYMTKDSGTTWSKIGSDPDLESPIEVNLPGDGSYGLTVVVRNKADKDTRPPKSGEQPQLRVDVDTDAPFAKLTQVAPDPAAPRERMSMSWESEDKHPAERSVDLYFTHDPEIGWQKIAGGLPPSGNHSWQVPIGIPYQVYFMLIARDQAGNEEKIFSQKPVIVDLSNPQGKIDAIIDVLPLKKGETDR